MTTPSEAAGPANSLTVWMLGLVSLLKYVSSEMINALLPQYLAGGLGSSTLVIGAWSEQRSRSSP